MAKDVARLSAESVGAVFGGLIGMSVGGPSGAFVGAAVTPWAAEWVARSFDEFRRRGETLAAAASAAARLEQDEVVRKALEDSNLDPLVRAILDAAARTDQIAALRVLGAILGNRATNGAPQIDEDVLITRAIAELQAPHIAVMEVLSGKPPVGEGEAPEWTLDDIAGQLAGNTSFLGPDAAVSGLVSLGLVTILSGFGTLIYRLSPLGASLREVINLAGGWSQREDQV